MKNLWKWIGATIIYVGAALIVILVMQYFYHSSDFFRSPRRQMIKSATPVQL